MKRLQVVLGGIAALVAFVGVAAAQPASDELYEILQRIKSHPDFIQSMEYCPADIAGTHGTNDTESIWRDCAVVPGLCLAECQSGGDEACFDLAIALEASDDSRFVRLDPQWAFARGCAFGHASSCTNRAAGLVRMPENWRAGFEKVDAENCAYRTFAMTCDAGDLWGCAMKGVFMAEGAGTNRDADGAQPFFRRVCSADPEGEPCQRVRDYIR